MVSQYPLHVCINTRQPRISRSSSCLSESPRNSSRVTSRCVHTAYNMVPDVIDVCDVRCETHTMSRSGALHVVTVAFFNAARKIFCWAVSSPHASVIVCDVAHVWIEAVCVCMSGCHICDSTHVYVYADTDVSDTHRPASIQVNGVYCFLLFGFNRIR